MLRVSVVIASYNHDRYIAEAIRSVLSQTYQDFEIVITDDGSTDATVAEIAGFSDPRIRLHCFEQNRGACEALCNCIERSRGQYICVLNSDDVFVPEKLGKQVRFLDTHEEVGAVFSCATFIDDAGRAITDESHFLHDVFNRENRTRFEWLNRFFYKGNCLCHPSVLIRKECYDSVGCYDKRYAQLPDLDFWIRLCMKFDINVTPDNLLKFRIRSDNANASAPRLGSLRRDFFEHTRILRNYLKIESVETFLRVFPEAREYEGMDSDSMAFVLAMLALKTGSKVHQNFALEVLSEQLENEHISRKLAADFGFRHIDFIALTGRHDLYGIENAHRFGAAHSRLCCCHVIRRVVIWVGCRVKAWGTKLLTAAASLFKSLRS